MNTCNNRTPKLPGLAAGPGGPRSPLSSRLAFWAPQATRTPIATLLARCWGRPGSSFERPTRNSPPAPCLALLNNAYNAFTLRLILDHLDDGRLESIKDIPASKRWKARRWVVGGHTWSLDDIEQKQIRPHFREPRIHFALVCAAVGCPPLRNEAYRAQRLEEQLEDQARYVHGQDRWFRYDESAGVVHLTELYNWYDSDCEQVAGSVLAYAARYSPALKRDLDQGRKPSIRWLTYDWQLNKKP